MSYFRGSTYIGSSGETLHRWTEDKHDDSRLSEGYASGVEIPEPVADQFAVMRVAELIKLGQLNAVIDAALTQGNFGGDALAGLAPLLRQVGRSAS